MSKRIMSQGIPGDPNEVFLDPKTSPYYPAPASPNPGEVKPAYDPDDPPYYIGISSITAYN